MQHLWLQGAARNKQIYMAKVDTTINPADLGTKPLYGNRIESLMKGMGFDFPDESKLVR